MRKLPTILAIILIGMMGGSDCWGALLDDPHTVQEPSHNTDGNPIVELIRCTLTVWDQTGTIKTREFLAASPGGGGIHEWNFRDIFPEVIGTARATAVCTNPVGDSEVSNTLEVQFPVKDLAAPLPPVVE